MDPALLNEMLHSLRIIRDEIGKLRETDAAHKTRIDSLENAASTLETNINDLNKRADNYDGGTKVRDRITAGAATIAALVIAAWQLFK